MKILHYMFGIPPVRVGGLVRYATDLMKRQYQMGHEVTLLIPGNISKNGRRKTVISPCRNNYMQIPSYDICNPLPIPMCNGITDIQSFTQCCDGREFAVFLQKLKPQIIHIHTFMGLHREFLDEAEKAGIPMIFTTHDYFGICPTAVMLFRGHICEDTEWENCGFCCQNAFSQRRLKIEQSEWYRIFRKHPGAVRVTKQTMRKVGSLTCKSIKLLQTVFGIQRSKERLPGKTSWNGKDYAVLKKYYASMFARISYFHFNSTTARTIFERRLGQLRGEVVPVSHSQIDDHRKKRVYGKKLRIGYLGSWAEHKGFFDLIKVCDALVKDGCTKLELHIYSDTDQRTEPYVVNHACFDADQLGDVFCDMDLLTLPGIWPETFGLVALEALSYGVPVVFSAYAGAIDLLHAYPDIGFAYDGSMRGLKEILQKIYENRELLLMANDNILKMDDEFSYDRHVSQILYLYERFIR